MKTTNNSKLYNGPKRMVVFLVDDDMFFSEILRQIITDKTPHLEIKIFQTGEACLQHMKLKPDVIVLDYYLNSKLTYAWNGMDILKRIQVLNPTTKVVLLSSQTSIEVANECLKNGAFDYISKSKSAFVRINKILAGVIQEVE
jgi:two-component system OmpR family response regulator